MRGRRHDLIWRIVHGGGISVYDTITDGDVTWTVCNLHIGAFNTKQTFTTSGTFVAPVTGTYRITLYGGGGGGADISSETKNSEVTTVSGGGGGQGGVGKFYANLTAGTSYSYVIGAGGLAGTSTGAGSAGGDSSITIGNDTYTCTGGQGGANQISAGIGGTGGLFQVNGTNDAIQLSLCGQNGNYKNANTPRFPIRGGYGGAMGPRAVEQNIGAGGTGASLQFNSATIPATAGHNGSITFEYCDVA